MVDLAVPVTPAHIAYTGLDGFPAEDIGYFGDRTLGACLLALFKRRQIQATVRFGEPVHPSDNRKTLAAQLHAAVTDLAGNAGAAP
ncbi:MAG: hypothetical protein EBS01_11490 [Verrucomicrobia bacterium]|nr:hypothetical protein [Verrucomicrobiota bacterium]